MSLTIWHNPRCSKSRQTLALIEERGITPKVRLYLDDQPSIDEIKNVLDCLNIPPIQLIRVKEAEFKEQNLTDSSDDQLIQAMAQTPKLIERPIVLSENKAAIGRPPENILKLF